MGDYRPILDADPRDWIEFAGIDYQVVEISEPYPNPIGKNRGRCVSLTLEHNGAQINITLDTSYIIKFLNWKEYK